MTPVKSPFPSSLAPLFQSESKCESILRKMTLICMKMKLHPELIFIWKVSHLDSFWNRGTRELGNCPFQSKIRKISRCHPSSPKYVELGHFTLLLNSERQRNVQILIIQPFLLLVKPCVYWRSRVVIRDFKIWCGEAIVRRQIVKITSGDVMTRALLRLSRRSLAFYNGKVPSFTYSSLREYKPAVLLLILTLFHCLNSLVRR